MSVKVIKRAFCFPQSAVYRYAFDLRYTRDFLYAAKRALLFYFLYEVIDRKHPGHLVEVVADSETHSKLSTVPGPGRKFTFEMHIEFLIPESKRPVGGFDLGIFIPVLGNHHQVRHDSVFQILAPYNRVGYTRRCF